MLIQFFKNNNPASFILLPLIALVMWIPAFIGDVPTELNQGMPLYSLICSSLLKSGFLSTLLSLILVITQAFLLNFILTENEILSSPNYLPALFFIVFMSYDKHVMVLHPLLFSNIFLLLAIHKITSAYRLSTAFSNAYDAGFFLAIAALFYLPTIIFIALIGIGLQIFRPFIWREWIIALLGILTPLVFLFTYYFWNDLITVYLLDKNYFSFFQEQIQLEQPGIYYSIIGIGLLLLIPPLLDQFKDSYGSSQKTKKGTILFKWYFLFSLLSSIFTMNPVNILFCFIAIPGAAFFANYFYNFKKGWLIELTFSIFLLLIITNHFFN